MNTNKAIPFSIYIPRMSNIHDEEAVKNILKILRIGVVRRVDFTPINKSPGFGENDDEVKSAFIHFFDTPAGFPLDTPAGFPYDEVFWSEIARGDSCRIAVSKSEYWIFLKNNNPVKETLMNIHQVAENGRHLEKLIEEQANTIKQQEKMIQELSKSLDGVRAVVYQLVGGVYCQSTQGDMFNAHFKLLYPEWEYHQYSECTHTTSKWTNWPTTRQGDECERRIEALEKMLSVYNEEEDEEQLKIEKAMREEERYREIQEEVAVEQAAEEGW